MILKTLANGMWHYEEAKAVRTAKIHLGHDKPAGEKSRLEREQKILAELGLELTTEVRYMDHQAGDFKNYNKTNVVKVAVLYEEDWTHGDPKVCVLVHDARTYLMNNNGTTVERL